MVKNTLGPAFVASIFFWVLSSQLQQVLSVREPESLPQREPKKEETQKSDVLKVLKKRVAFTLSDDGVRTFSHH